MNLLSNDLKFISCKSFHCSLRLTKGLGEVRVIEFRQARRTEAKFII